MSFIKSLLDGLREMAAVQKRLLPGDRTTLKSMALMGRAAFGPPCGNCGKPMTSFIPARQRGALERLAGEPVENKPGVCHCPAERERLAHPMQIVRTTGI